MKEEKLFDMIKNIDDDLICEMLDYSPETAGDVYEGVLYSIPHGTKKRRFWMYPVTAAALLTVMGALLFIINSNGAVPDNMEVKTDSEQTESALNTNSTNAPKDTEEGTDAPVTEANTHIIPDKAVFVEHTNVLFTDQYPEIPKPDLSEAQFTEMSTSELCEYYGLLNIPCEMEQGGLIEDTNENTSHGIYTLSDGSTYDINTFSFKVPYDTGIHGKKFTVTVGRNTTFGEEYNQEPILEAGKTVYYNEADETFFMVFEKYGSYITISGKADELSDFDSPTAKEAFYDQMKPNEHEEYWKGVPCELGLFIQNVAQCAKEPTF